MSALLLGLELETLLLLGLVGAAAATVIAYQSEEQTRKSEVSQILRMKKDRQNNPRAHLDESEVLFKDHRRDNIRNVTWDGMVV